MKDFSDNPYNIPGIDIGDIPVLDDIVTQKNEAAISSDESILAKEEHNDERNYDRNDESINEVNNTNIDTAQLELIIEQIAIEVTTKIHQELETQIEETVLNILEDSLHKTLQQNREFIKESISSLLKKKLPDLFKARVTDATSIDQSTL